MARDSKEGSAAVQKLSQDILDGLAQLFGSHPGFRPVHAKGATCSGTFTPSPAAVKLTRAPHAQRESTPVVVRFSDFAGVPMVPDNDPNGASPRGFAVRFYLAEHEHTDIVGHSEDGFPTRTGEEFLEFARALAASVPDAQKPTALDKFLANHPETAAFLQDPKPIPTSFAKESFFAVTAFKFTNKDGQSRYGRFQILPVAGNEYLDDAAAKGKGANFLFDELSQRLAREPIKLRVLVQVAEEGDPINDSTKHWPNERKLVEFGTIVLTQRVSDDDPEKRKIIFDPIPRVDGIEPSADPLIELRSAIYLMSGRRRREQAGHSHG